MKEIRKIFVNDTNNIEETILAIQRGGVGIALVVDEQERLLGTVTDGDIRRAILNKIPLSNPIATLFSYRSAKYPQPVTAPYGIAAEALLALMQKKELRQIPLLDKNGRIVELALLSELIDGDFHFPLTAVVMAGGKGKRLYPLTKDMPKPMLPLTERPLIERTIEQFRKIGIRQVHIATHYKSEVITEHFGNGDDFGVKINYINEEEPLGTAGALGLMDTPDKLTLIVNGDILTQLDFLSMFDFHRDHKAVMTVGVRKCEFEIPYGVIDTNDILVKEITEKPVKTFIVNAGIYLVEPGAYRYIPKGRHFDMTDLISTLIKAKHKVICFPIQEYWMDIGQPVHYQQVRDDAKNGKI
ncbi:MAG: nucleotidyltransferase family protein [Candidatus Omnitrophota bacterium]